MSPAPDAKLAKAAANTLRFLSVDAVEKAKSGHPGLPMGAADVAFVLWGRFLRYDPLSYDSLSYDPLGYDSLSRLASSWRRRRSLPVAMRRSR